MHRYLLTFIISWFVTLSGAFSQDFIKPTKYDWSLVAGEITKGCSNDYDRAKAIYRWITANISYDTSYSIYHADDCWEQKRGVCQAYCELFYHIAGALGIRTDIISGKSKDILKKSGEHAWIYVETDKEQHRGILIDPTWGAGSVNNGVFMRKNNDMSWFHVNPYMLIFTHFPDNQEYQLIDGHLSYEEFILLPPLYPEIEQLGLNGEDLFRHCRKNPADMPKFYSNSEGVPFYIEEIPIQNSLRTGETYRFALRKTDQDFSLICGNEFVGSDKWEYNNGVLTLDYTVPCGEELSLSWKNKKDGLFYTVVSYTIPVPSEIDLENLENKRVYSMPEITDLLGNKTVFYKEKGFDGKKILEGIRNGSVKTLPEIFDNDGITVVDVPINGTLDSGRKYTFRIKQEHSGKLAIINNKDWYKEWTSLDNDGLMEIEVYPNPGTLIIAIQESSGKGYTYCMRYKVR